MLHLQDICKELTGLKDESRRNLDVSAVACWFDAFCSAYQWADDEGCSVANGIERPEGNPHRQSSCLLK